jgi:hypothetical protein
MSARQLCSEQHTEMTRLAWAILLVLGIAAAIALAAGASITGFVFAAVILGVWMSAGLLVKRDAQRLGVIDSEWAGSMVLVWGLPGLLWWFGYRRGRADVVGSPRSGPAA